MFADNKYTRFYYQIINSALNDHRVKLSKSSLNYIYYESHHIIPKSLNGNNKKENLVLLTPREHFICHWLLTKMVYIKKDKEKMLNAFSGMFNWKEKRNLSSKQYQILRLVSSKRFSSEEANRKRSIALKGRVSPNKGKTLSKEHVEKMRVSLTGKRKKSYNQTKPHRSARKCTDGIITYNTIKEMALKHNIVYSTMVHYVKNNVNGFSYY